MSTKLEIIELINTNLADDSEILASEHRDVENALVNELFPDIFSEKDSSLTNEITAKNTVNTKLKYNIYFVKQGRMVYVYGSITNTSTEIIDFSNNDNFFFEITNSEYQTSLPSTIRFVNGNETIKIQSNKFYYSQIGAGATKNFNFHYPANS